MRTLPSISLGVPDPKTDLTDFARNEGAVWRPFIKKRAPTPKISHCDQVFRPSILDQHGILATEFAEEFVSEAFVGDGQFGSVGGIPGNPIHGLGRVRTSCRLGR